MPSWSFGGGKIQDMRFWSLGVGVGRRGRVEKRQKLQGVGRDEMVIGHWSLGVGVGMGEGVAVGVRWGWKEIRAAGVRRHEMVIGGRSGGGGGVGLERGKSCRG